MGPRDQEDEQSQGLSSESADTASVNEESFDNLRHCNIRKVLNVAEAKRQNSVLGMQFLRFCVFLCVYLFLVYNHRQAYVSESLYSGIKKRLAMTPFRDPETLAMKTWFDIVTVEDFWNWHEFVLVPQLLADSPTVPGPEERADALAKANTLLHHNKLVGSFRMTVIRAKERACAVPAKYAGAFARADADGGARVLLVTLFGGASGAGGGGAAGLDLTHAKLAVLLEPALQPGIEAQAAGRIHRIGQRGAASAVRLVATGTVEPHVIRYQEARNTAGPTGAGSAARAASQQLVESVILPTLRDRRRDEDAPSAT